MELAARLGLGERRKESGRGGRSGVRCEVEVRVRSNFATPMQSKLGDKALVLR
jgi:hypothetical protein